jgi:hypothetical protein
MCLECHEHVKNLTKFEYQVFLVKMKNGELNYSIEDVDGHIDIDYNDPYHLRYRKISENNFKTTLSILENSPKNLLTLKKQILAMNQIITVQKAREKTIQMLQIHYWWKCFHPIAIKYNLPDEITRMIIDCIVS